MSEKSIGSKFIGLFVETEGGEGPADPANLRDGAAADGEKSPADIVAELARSTGAAPVAGARPGAAAAPAGPPLKTDRLTAPEAGKPADFDAIFRDAGMDPSELDTVKKAEELLKSLPAETPHAVKKQIVEASLKAFGFDVMKIPAAASNQKRALDAYVRVNETATAKSVSDAQAEIQRLNDQIAKLRGEIEKKNATLVALTTQAGARKQDVQKVIEFFQGAAPAATP